MERFSEPEGERPGSQDPLADTPLFREIQRVLMSSSGPINWELARQVGIAVASWSDDDPEPTEDDRRAFEEAVRVSELTVAETTGLPSPPEVTRVEAVRRARWVEANVEGLRDLFEPGASRLAHILDDARKSETPAMGESPAALETMIGQMSPLLMGAQVGTVLGQLGQRVLGQYELPFPRRGRTALLFVVPNIARFEREWSLPPVDFRAWVALHETTHAFTIGRPWVADYLHALIRELAEGMEFDLAGLESRIAGLDLSDPQRLSEALGDPGELLGQTISDEQRIRMRRLQAFMSAAEGHADHVMNIAGRKWLPAFPQIEEAMRRRHEGRSQEERLIERLLGLELKAEQYRLGRSFCERVTELTDEDTLSRMWEGPESLPSMPELEEPSLWLARMV
ncbi:MAG TPA: zinc-dependent metalloprotease [Actinomycetota bacterium]|nr:zinc-dependent metalloprotease [Actinomycetota bacterium]